MEFHKAPLSLNLFFTCQSTNGEKQEATTPKYRYRIIVRQGGVNWCSIFFFFVFYYSVIKFSNGFNLLSLVIGANMKYVKFFRWFVKPIFNQWLLQLVRMRSNLIWQYCWRLLDWVTYAQLHVTKKEVWKYRTGGKKWIVNKNDFSFCTTVTATCTVTYKF